jgi:hypothetical protein
MPSTRGRSTLPTSSNSAWTFRYEWTWGFDRTPERLRDLEADAAYHKTQQQVVLRHRLRQIHPTTEVLVEAFEEQGVAHRT